MNDFKQRRFLSRRQQAARYGKCLKTIERWGRDPAMGLPVEYDLNGRPHRLEDQLEIWERSRVAGRAEAAGDRRRATATIATADK
jgi:hypothetical protein